MNENKLDPLAEVGLPNICNLLNWNHHSATQTTYPDGPIAYRYLICDQKTRRMFEGNANMAAGVAVNNAIQYFKCKTIFKLNPTTKKLAPVENPIMELGDAQAKALEEYDKYTPVNSKDEEKFQRYKETIPQTISMLAKAIETLGVSKDVVGEGVINFTDQRLHLPIIGRSDLEYSQQVFIDAASSHSHSVAPFGLLEIKTSWDRLGKLKKDGSRSFLSPKVPLTPQRNHLIQVAFYKKCKPKHDAKLVYVTKDDFKVFDKNNCQDLTDENLENYYEEMVRTCLRRERQVLKYNDLTDKQKFITEIVKDLDPQFDHPFLWSIGDQFVKAAKELWSSNGGNK
jgi:hypothetical protein